MMRRLRTGAALILPALALLAACGSDDAAGSPPDVVGREFVSTEVSGHELVDGSTIRIAFETDTLSANAGCNTMNGGYSFDGDTLQVETLAMTQMACGEALTDQEAFVSGLLTNEPTVTLDGDELTIASGDETITMLDRQVAEPDLPVEGTDWMLDGIVANDAISTVPIGVEASLLIEDGQASIDTGCNQGATSVAVTDTTLTFDPIATTLMLCEESANEVQASVVGTLVGEVTYEIEADRLSIRAADGSGLDFRAAT